jgi:UDP-N-acetylglucosamine 2-epimerase (non-hydrolysing)
MKKALTLFGTRPELIKLYPVLRLLKTKFNSKVCFTKQHDSLIAPLLASYNLKIDHGLELQESNNSLTSRAAAMLLQLEQVITKTNPDFILVQGDTLSSFIGAIAAFYAKIDLVHVEAGLRTYCMQSPWPEEFHRVMIAQIAKYHFAPTTLAKKALMKEGVAEKHIYVVGNTAIDAVRMALQNLPSPMPSKYVVITMHRRENFGETQKMVCSALKSLAVAHPQVQFRFYLHHNPTARSPIIEALQTVRNIELLEPLIHQEFVKLMAGALFIVTDSGGIQEEAAYIGKPVLVIRNKTERMEGIAAGGAILVALDQSKLLDMATKLLTNHKFLQRKSVRHTAFGDGFAAERITKVLAKHYAHS